MNKLDSLVGSRWASSWDRKASLQVVKNFLMLSLCPHNMLSVFLPFLMIAGKFILASPSTRFCTVFIGYAALICLNSTKCEMWHVTNTNGGKKTVLPHIATNTSCKTCSTCRQSTWVSQSVLREWIWVWGSSVSQYCPVRLSDSDSQTVSQKKLTVNWTGVCLFVSIVYLFSRFKLFFSPVVYRKKQKKQNSRNNQAHHATSHFFYRITCYKPGKVNMINDYG